MDRDNSCEGMQLFAPKTQQFNLIFSGSPVPALPWPRPLLDNYPGKSAAAGLSCSLPYYRHYSPPPIKLPLTALYRHAVEQVCDRPRNKWHRTGWLLARAGYVSPCCKVMCLWYMCFCAEVFFSVLTLYSQMEHSLGVKKIFSPHVNAVLFFHSLSSCSVYPVVICMLCMYGQVDG